MTEVDRNAGRGMCKKMLADYLKILNWSTEIAKPEDWLEEETMKKHGIMKERKMQTVDEFANDICVTMNNHDPFLKSQIAERVRKDRAALLEKADAHAKAVIEALLNNGDSPVANFLRDRLSLELNDAFTAAKISANV